ncbi:FAD-dependent oxidoreductase [Sulfurivermis fontis]|uniref:FAD-dependent oxidoreductase n=1 Tax=Sulfurivermis fontis TaxID=1972068 RepID=UPI000FD6FAE1|nr:FAD-dependent oxidoreductase [Sulfurivermis fontis]
MTTPADCQADVVICGGGVAGLWLLARLRQQGYRALLIENQALGAGQTRYAQGIIHGGTKYALTGAVSGSSEAIAAMPPLWRACLAGRGEIDLRAVRLMSDHQYLWSTASITSRMAGFFASKMMRSRIAPLDAADYPAVFRHRNFRGQVYRLEEPVLDTAALVHALALPHESAIWRGRVVQADGVRLTLDDGGQQITFAARQVVLTAGKGNAALLQLFGRDTPQMQTRPLKMVMVRGELPQGVYAHCLGASSNPRITISTHYDAQGRTVWYLGGDLAEVGVKRSDAEQRAAARQELADLLPWIDFSACEFATLDIERAEPRMPDGRRPDDVYVDGRDGVITAWPTKLAFAPRLAARIADMLKQENIMPSVAMAGFPAWPFPGYALLPWQEEERWS